MDAPKTRLYQKIEDYITNSIRNRELKEGQCLPSERELAKKFKSSHIPVRQATQNLINKGLLYRVNGKGTFVSARIKSAATNRLGVIYTYRDIDFYNSPTHSMLLAGVDAGAKEAGKDLLMRSLPTQDDRELSSFITSLEDDVDGIILVDSTVNAYQKVEKTLVKLSKPVVVTFFEGDNRDLDFVTADSRGDTKMVVDYLVENGHTRIGCLHYFFEQDPGLKPSIANRINAYREALAAHGLPVDEALIKKEDNDPPARYLKELMELPEPPTAVFCTTSLLALRVYKAAKLLGVKIPDDLTVIGYDNSRDCELADPPLSIVYLPLYDMGAEAVRRMMEKIEEQKQGRVTHRKQVFPGELTLRGSHKKLV